MTTTPGALSEREAIARVIDPHEWQLDDLAKKKGFRTVFTDESLAKADAILALRPPAPQGLRPEVLAFAYLMEDQLRANDHKPGWTDDLPCDLIPRLREEAIELEEATNRHAKRVAWGDGWMREDTRPRVAHEAADVANFAMMIADVCGALPSRLASLDALRLEGRSGWIVGSGDGKRFRTWTSGMSDWTEDRDQATRYARREDAEAVHREDEDAWCVVPYEPAGVELDAFRPMDQWDRRDEAVLLLVDYSDGDHPLDDALIAITIGHNNDHNVGDDEGQGWLFAGWCWTHDHYVQGKGKPIGWMPVPHHLAQDKEASNG